MIAVEEEEEKKEKEKKEKEEISSGIHLLLISQATMRLICGC